MTPSRRHLLAALTLGLLTLAVHWRLPEGWFYRDDFGFLVAARDATWIDHLTGLFDRVSYWRPGQDAWIDAVYEVFGPSALVYTLLGLGWHLAVVGMAYHVVAVATGSVLLATLVAAVSITAPIAVEVVYWMAASTSTAPAFALVFAAGLLTISTTLRGARRDEQARLDAGGDAILGRRNLALPWFSSATWRWALIGCLFAASFTFREYAYQFPLLVFVASLAAAPRGIAAAPRGIAAAVGRALPFGIVVILHYAFLNVISAPSGSALSYVGQTLQHYAGAVVGDPDASTGLAFGIGAVLLLALLVGDARARLFVCWTAFGTFPYLVKAYTDRYAYPLAVLAPIAVALTAARFGRPGRITAIIVLVVWSAFQTPRLVDSLARERDSSELCRAALEWSRSEDITRFDHIAVDHLPDALLNGWPPMLDLYLGKRVEVATTSLVAMPPFAILPAGALPPTEQTAFVQIDASARRFTRIPRAEFVGGLVEVPMLALLDHFVIEPDTDRARTLASDGSLDLTRSVVLSAPPPTDLVDAEPRTGSNQFRSMFLEPPVLRFEVDVVFTCALVLSLPVDLVAIGATATIDGEPTPLLRANGTFAAIYLGPGQHAVVIRTP